MHTWQQSFNLIPSSQKIFNAVIYGCIVSWLCHCIMFLVKTNSPCTKVFKLLFPWHHLEPLRGHTDLRKMTVPECARIILKAVLQWALIILILQRALNMFKMSPLDAYWTERLSGFESRLKSWAFKKDKNILMLHLLQHHPLTPPCQCRRRLGRSESTSRSGTCLERTESFVSLTSQGAHPFYLSRYCKGLMDSLWGEAVL